MNYLRINQQGQDLSVTLKYINKKNSNWQRGIGYFGQEILKKKGLPTLSVLLLLQLLMNVLIWFLIMAR